MVVYSTSIDWEEKVAESGAKFCGYENHRQLSEQIKNAYAVAESMIEDAPGNKGGAEYIIKYYNEWINKV